ncbi:MULTISPECIES: hypothetical protein [unclassified Nonomuraea]|uniref:hypothetical protein n=1 Tax=unclassified Nonomuraea TaxID=2593643 RepID=UPI0033C1B13E
MGGKPQDEHPPGRRSQDAPAGADESEVVLRISSRLVPAGVRVHIARWPLGGLHVWTTDTSGRSDGSTWVMHHRIARQVALAGWHAEVSADGVLVLGWGAAALKHRVRLLHKALSGRLADFPGTASLAVDGAIRAARDQRLGRTPGEVMEAACEHVREQLRWPRRLADLDGLARTSQLNRLSLLLAQVDRLEVQVRRACDDHLALARIVAGAMAELLASGQDPAQARRQVLHTGWALVRASHVCATAARSIAPAFAGGTPGAGLVERHIVASVRHLPAAHPHQGPPR